jgi:hypothetical protein
VLLILHRLGLVTRGEYFYKGPKYFSISADGLQSFLPHFCEEKNVSTCFYEITDLL